MTGFILKHNAESKKLVGQLNDAGREAALRRLKEIVNPVDLNVYDPADRVNVHGHTTASYSGNGWSPSRLAWELYRRGARVAGIVDFDTLDGLEEMFAAGDILGLKTVVGLETRVFVSDWSSREINSPGEPGVAYFMGIGFSRPFSVEQEEAMFSFDLKETSKRRNLQMIGLINRFLDSVRIGYESDVIPLTPNGNATERHILEAYDIAARRVWTQEGALRAFWSKKLSTPLAELPSDSVKLQELMRKRLMKQGGKGYTQPDSDTFLPLSDVVSRIRAMGALPTYAWLDGTSNGENNPRELLEFFIEKGAVALNIILDRNWNIVDLGEQRVKYQKLCEVIEAANGLYLPIAVGTEMNKPGQKVIDDFESRELRPFVGDFMNGAYFVYGHTVLARYAGFGYFSDGAMEAFGDHRQPENRRVKNEFYTNVGKLPMPTPEQVESLERLRGKANPTTIMRVYG